MIALDFATLAATPGLPDPIRHWLAENGTLVFWISAISAGLCLCGIALVPVIAARLPVDYLLRLSEGRAAGESPRHWSVTVARNLGGGLLIFTGLLLVPLPGPGVFVMLAGLGLMDFPAKRRLMLHLVRRPAVLDPINRVRRMFGQQELLDAAAATDHRALVPESAQRLGRSKAS